MAIQCNSAIATDQQLNRHPYAAAIAQGAGCGSGDRHRRGDGR